MDPVADMLTIIRNGYLAQKESVNVPYSKFKHEIAKVLSGEKFIGNVKKDENRINIDLVYKKNNPVITELKRISKLGLRTYQKAKKIKSVKGGRGVYIISTPEGVMSSSEAKKRNLGGEIICRVW